MAAGKNRSVWMNALICANLTAFWAVFYYTGPLLNVRGLSDKLWPLQKIEFMFTDLRFEFGRKAAVHPDLVFLGIDQPVETRPHPEEFNTSEALFLMQENFPWSRAVWAEAVERLADVGAAAVVLDLLFTSPGTGDQALQEAVGAHAGEVVLGVNEIMVQLHGGRTSQSLAWPPDTVLPQGVPWETILGTVNFRPDADSKVRRVAERAPMIALGDGVFVHSLSSLAALKYGHYSHRPPGAQQTLFRYAGPPGTYGARPVYEMFDSATWQQNFANGEFFRGKIVLIGPAANWHHDFHPTPFGDMLGPEIHLHALGAILTDDFIHEPSMIADVLLIAFGGLLAWFILCFIHSPVKQALALLVWSAAFMVTTQWLYNTHGWLLIAFTPLAALNSSGIACMLRQFVLERLERARTRNTLEKYVSPAIVQEILDKSDDFENVLGGARKSCTMLFSDLRGFTTMTESADSQELVALLNEYLGEMVECVFRHKGNLDKFMGDAVMAIWGNVAGVDPVTDARNAVDSALDMITSLEQLNTKWRAEGCTELRNGIGLNHGEVIVGNIGSPRRKEFTVIGDAVNLASRLEGVTKEYGLSLVIGESVAALIRGFYPLQTVDFIKVKGKSKPIDTFTVVRPEPDLDALKAYEEAVALYRKGSFPEARALLQKKADRLAHNTLAQLYLVRIDELISNPPEGVWDGVYTMRTK